MLGEENRGRYSAASYTYLPNTRMREAIGEEYSLTSETKQPVLAWKLEVSWRGFMDGTGTHNQVWQPMSRRDKNEEMEGDA